MKKMLTISIKVISFLKREQFFFLIVCDFLIPYECIPILTTINL